MSMKQDRCNMTLSPFLKIQINPEALVIITRCIDYSPQNAKGNIFCSNWCKLNAKNKHPLNTQLDEQDVMY